MSSITTAAQFIIIRDKLLLAINKLAQDGITSYTIGDQTFSLADVGDLISQVQKLDRIIATKSRTLGNIGINRIDVRSFNG
jgi:hypothetical protein